MAVDANVLVAAMLGGRTRDLLVRGRRAGLTLITAVEVIREVEEHIPEQAEYVGVRPDSLKLALWSLPVESVANAEYASQMAHAADLMKDRDPDDAPLVALALTRDIPVWSNDRDFRGLPGIRVMTTVDVARMIAEAT